MIYFILNPKAKSSRGVRGFHEIEKQLQKEAIPFKVYRTHRAGDASVIASKLTRGDKKRIIIVLGGDGTLNEFLNGVRNTSNVILGYIPIGSGNDFARGMGISGNMKKEFAKILEMYQTLQDNPDTNLRRLDFGELSYPDGISKRFFVSCGVGYDAKVCVKVETSRLKSILNRLHLGRLIYMILGLRYLINAETYSGSLYLDGEKVLSGDSFLFVSWQNQAYEGGGFYFCPGALADDGYLDVCVAKGIPKWKIPFIIPLAKFGWHTNCKGVYLYHCKNAVIKSETENYVHTDGETRKNMRELHIRVVENAISFLQ